MICHKANRQQAFVQCETFYVFSLFRIQERTFHNENMKMVFLQFDTLNASSNDQTEHRFGHTASKHTALIQYDVWCASLSCQMTLISCHIGYTCVPSWEATEIVLTKIVLCILYMYLEMKTSCV